MTHSELSRLRELRGAPGGGLGDNLRPRQPLHSRALRTNIESGGQHCRAGHQFQVREIYSAAKTNKSF